MSKKIVPTLQNRDVVLIGDLKSSRKLEDRAKVQEGLKNALFGINKELEKGIITKIFAAKSIARFNELTDRKMAEYYLTGTLVSIAFALVTGILTRVIIGGDRI